MGKIDYDGKIYEFDWIRILILIIGAPVIALGIYFSHDWVWLHGISAKITVPIINLITGNENYLIFVESRPLTPWVYQIVSEDGTRYGPINMETLCTGVQAIAIFVGVILVIPHNTSDNSTTKLPAETSPIRKILAWIKEVFNNKDNIWRRKLLAIFWTTLVFYIVNILRMVIQLSLYNGSNWDDLHYPISSASSFIAVACVLIVHKFVPEFIISLMWIGEEIKFLISGPQNEVKNVITKSDDNLIVSEEENENVTEKID
ncbi:hypothetical protein [Candidatus Lokiarchaeum ossiferum]|uniref:hypothetical protein n=1 Tax=Candidatus Lokiarchaeum ossiferum TaxID=2951803 RepID=UPI00352D8AEB